MTEVTPLQDWQNLATLLETLRLSDLLTTVVGTFFGAWAAFKFSSVREEKHSHLREISALNRVNVTAFSYLNVAKNMKKQFILGKLSELNDQTDAIENYFSDSERNKPAPKFQHLLVMPQPLQFITGENAKAVSELTTLNGRPLLVAKELDRSAASLNGVIQEHNRLIQEIKNICDQEQKLFTILGLVQENGQGKIIDERFRNSIEHLNLITDDMLFFSSLIIKDATSHFQILKRKYDREIVHLISLDTSDPEYEKLMPDESLYESWLSLPNIRT